MSSYNGVFINSNDKCIPHILNFSVLKYKPETLQHSLEEYDIYISTKTACSSKDQKSISVYELTKDENRALTSVRVSISHLTTKNELDEFLRVFDIIYNKL